MEYKTLESAPCATAVVDAAINLFAQLLPLQDLASLSSTISHLLESVRSVKTDKNAGRKAAITINAAVAILLALRSATAQYFRQSKETFGKSAITTLLTPFFQVHHLCYNPSRLLTYSLQNCLSNGDPMLRYSASEAIGRLASLADTPYLTSQIKSLVDQVVGNRDPNARAGCALAFGAIYSHVGGLATGPLLKTTVNILTSLSSDPHPVVHFWALTALSKVVNAASLAYVPFISSTLSLLLKVYLSDSHEMEGGSLSSVNAGGAFPAYPTVCQIIDAIITVLGPDIQESHHIRTLVLSLVHEFSLETDEATLVEAIKCTQHLLLFASDDIQLPELIDRFRVYLSSSQQLLKITSITALYQLVQKDALAVSRLGGDQLVEDLFSMLDDDPSVDGVRNVISSWLRQTVVHNPSAWIDLCQRIMSRTTASQQVVEAASKQKVLHEDEGDFLNVDTQNMGTPSLTSCWRTQLFALQCLHDICSIISRSGGREHIDIAFAKLRGLQINRLLVFRVPDLIKMAFTASAAFVSEIRMEGLVVLCDVIQVRTFARLAFGCPNNQ
jgi:HEAT repeat-containing protein 5